MAGEEQPGRFPLDLGHQFTVPAIADVVLRDRLWIKHAMLEGRLALHAQQHAQVFARQREQFAPAAATPAPGTARPRRSWSASDAPPARGSETATTKRLCPGS